MKKIISIILLININLFVVAATDLSNISPVHVVKYETGLENSLVLPMNFAQEFFISQTNLNLLKNNSIHQIDLVYTAYKSSPTFNQVDLNQRRISSLVKLIPKINNDNAVWRLIEQTGAKTAIDAKSYFHGFVIHYGQSLQYKELKDFFSTYNNQIEIFEINNQVQSEIITESGSRIVVQPNSMVTKNGNLVQGDVVLTYQEFRNPAEIALSGIPMTFANEDGDYNFSSVGMYEVNAELNGEELSLIKPIAVDFNCTEVKTEVSFYQMNSKGDWKELQPVHFNSAKIVVAEDKNVVDENEIVGENQMWNGERAIKHWRHGMFFFRGIKLNIDQQPLISSVTMNKKGWRGYLKLKAENDTLFSKMVTAEIPQERTVKVNTNELAQFNVIVLNPEMKGNWVMNDCIRKPRPNDMGSTLLGGGSSDPGHTYPTVVRGLNSPDFGVYNCDQIYRIGKSMRISPIYVDAESGQEIMNKHVTCVMDLTYNGSFSFHPNNLTLNAEGRNVILLFTTKKEIFMLDEQGFADLPRSNYNPTLSMVNITSKVSNSQDLKAILGV